MRSTLHNSEEGTMVSDGNRAFIAREFEVRAAMDELAELWDVDPHDGWVSHDEYCAGLARREAQVCGGGGTDTSAGSCSGQTVSRELCDELWQVLLLDRDGDERLDEYELAVARRPNMLERHALFARSDRNEDAQLSPSEFLVAVLREAHLNLSASRPLWDAMHEYGVDFLLADTGLDWDGSGTLGEREFVWYNHRRLFRFMTKLARHGLDERGQLRSSRQTWLAAEHHPMVCM
jgi:hypothetical protein